MLNVVLFGPPGAGKGTQAEKIIKKFNLIHLSTGEILRAEIAAETELGLIAKTYMDKGNLVSDEVVIEMVKARVFAYRNANGFIFDGFPRTVTQAVELDKFLEVEKTPVSVLLALDVEHDELVNRLKGRAKDSGRTDDMQINIIENRIAVYKKITLPVMDFYKKQGKLSLIDGIGSIDAIFNRIRIVLDSI